MRRVYSAGLTSTGNTRHHVTLKLIEVHSSLRGSEMPNDFNQVGPGSFDEFLARYLAGEQARQGRSIDLSRFLTARTQQILQSAGRFALERGQTELDALHILRTIVEDDSVSAAIERIGAAPDAIVAAIEARLPQNRGPADLEAATRTPRAPRA